MQNPTFQRWLYFVSLVLAAESIYMLPYLRKTFQTSMEEVFALGAVDLGLLNSMYGLIALAAYFPGGWLADRFSARKLLTFSLFATSAGGIYMATIPSHGGLVAVHAFWGITSILTFWAALIKAVRNWSGPTQQGTGFGMFEAGRGIVAAVLASLALIVFANSTSSSVGLVSVIWFYSTAAMIAGVLVWLLVPDELYQHAETAAATPAQEQHAAHWSDVLSTSRSWYLAAVIFCAYLLYVGTYDFPAYAERGFDQTKLFGAQLGTFRDWMRPFAAIAAGLLADRFASSRVIGVAFGLLALVYATLALLPAGPSLLWLLWGQVAVAAAAGFALRAVFYALLQETNVPLSQTGMTVGFISVVGYAPDVFMHTIAGRFVEAFGVDLGYRTYFGCLFVVALVGFVVLLQLLRTNTSKPQKSL
ncbi:MAG: MFS transporter [Filomicrobium sp.]